jgi:hypothetical protein
MFYLYDKGKHQSITDVGTEIILKMDKVFRAFGRKSKIERIYEEGYDSIGPRISFEDMRGGWRENTDAV